MSKEKTIKAEHIDGDSRAAIDDPLLRRVDVFFSTNDDDKDFDTDLMNGFNN